MNVAEKFFRFEANYDVSQFTVNGFWYYPIVKMMIYFELAGRKSKVSTVNKSGKNIFFLKTIFKQFYWAIKWKLKSAKLRPVKYLFVDYAYTRRKVKNGYFENIYTEPILRMIKADEQLLLEYPADEFGHYSKIRKTGIVFLDWVIFVVYLKARLKKKNYLENNDLLKTFFETFGLDCNCALINNRIKKTIMFIQIFKRLLHKVQPRLILLVDGYDFKQMALIYAAKELSIPTIELQHGLIHRSHMGYMYKSVHNRLLFADYLFTFGEYFSHLIRKNSVAWPEKNVVAVGFPYIEMVKNRPVTLPEKLKEIAAAHTIILITSQWTVRKVLCQFVLDLSALLDTEYFILYKIHPGEDRAQEFYAPFSEKENIELIDDKSIDSLELMKVASIHSTVYSTSYFESVYFALPNVFVYVPQYYSLIRDFVDEQTAFLVKDVEEYLRALNRIKNDAALESKLQRKRSFFYLPHALDNIMTQMQGILKNNFK